MTTMRSLNGDDQINAALDATMQAILGSLVAEGIIAPTVARNYCASHIALITSDKPMWKKILSYVGSPENTESESTIVILKAIR